MSHINIDTSQIQRRCQDLNAVRYEVSSTNATLRSLKNYSCFMGPSYRRIIGSLGTVIHSVGTTSSDIQNLTSGLEDVNRKYRTSEQNIAGGIDSQAVPNAVLSATAAVPGSIIPGAVLGPKDGGTTADWKDGPGGLLYDIAKELGPAGKVVKFFGTFADIVTKWGQHGFGRNLYEIFKNLPDVYSYGKNFKKIGEAVQAFFKTKGVVTMADGTTAKWWQYMLGVDKQSLSTPYNPFRDVGADGVVNKFGTACIWAGFAVDVADAGIENYEEFKGTGNWKRATGETVVESAVKILGPIAVHAALAAIPVVGPVLSIVGPPIVSWAADAICKKVCGKDFAEMVSDATFDHVVPAIQKAGEGIRNTAQKAGKWLSSNAKRLVAGARTSTSWGSIVFG